MFEFIDLDENSIESFNSVLLLSYTNMEKIDDGFDMLMSKRRTYLSKKQIIVCYLAEYNGKRMIQYKKSNERRFKLYRKYLSYIDEYIKYKGW
jgi:hypothetical protein